MACSLPRLLPPALLCFAALPMTAIAQTDWYVDPVGGHDRNGGLSVQDALLTVEEALGLAGEGDTVLLLPGQHAAFTLTTDGIAVEGFPTAEVLVGAEGFAIRLDAGQADFGASTRIQDLVLRGIGNDGAGVLLEGGGKMSARLIRLQCEDLAFGVDWSATGPAPLPAGQVIRGSGLGGGLGSWGAQGGAVHSGKNRLQLEDCVFLGGSGGGGGDLPQVAIRWDAGNSRTCEATVLDCRIEDYPVGMDLRGGTPMSAKLEGNTILRAETGIHMITGAVRSARQGQVSWGAQEARPRLLENTITFAASGGSGGGGGDLPDKGILLVTEGQVPLAGRIAHNFIEGFAVSVKLSGGGGGGGDLPPEAMVLRIHDNTLFGGGGSGGGGGDLPGDKGIHVVAAHPMPLEVQVDGNQVEDFLTGSWLEGTFGTGLLITGNVYTQVTTDEVLIDTSP